MSDASAPAWVIELPSPPSPSPFYAFASALGSLSWISHPSSPSVLLTNFNNLKSRHTSAPNRA